MKLSKEKIMREAERFLKRTEQYQDNRYLADEDNFQIAYVLAKDGRTQPENIIAYAMHDDTMICFYPFRKNEPAFDDWSFNFDTHLFEDLENGYEIVGMSLDCHFGVWATIEDWKDGDIDHVEGMQKYLAHCKRNGITKGLLEEKVSYDGMDVMTLYSKTTLEKGNSEKER